MRAWMLALFLTGCTCNDPAPTKAQERAAQIKAKSKAAQANRAKAAKSAKSAKAGKAGKASRAGNGASGGKATPPIGIAGPMSGTVVLAPEDQGNVTKTRAQLHMTWEGGEHTALLGVTEGTCEAATPEPLAEGVLPTWWTTCSWKDIRADFATLVQGPTVVVQRRITKGEQTGEWLTVRRIHLVQGAELTAGTAESAPAPAPAVPPPAEGDGE